MIKELFSASEVAAFSRNPDEAIAAQGKIIDNYKADATSQKFEAQAVLIRQLRNVTRLALEEDGPAQETLLRAYVRIQNPDLRAPDGGDVMDEAMKQGILNGRLAAVWERISTGHAPASMIAEILPNINQAIKGRVGLANRLRSHTRDELRRFGLWPDAAYDYFAEENANIPGVSKEDAVIINQVREKP
jgi:hypothetical protein